MASFNFNKVILAGRIANDFELKQTNSGTSVTSFTIAVNRKYQKGDEKQADFINVVAWRGTAEFLANFFKKGSSICITGELQTRTWTDNNGNKRYATEVIADEAYFVDSKAESATNNAAQTGGSYVPEQYAQPTAPKFVQVEDESDLPF